MRTFFMLAIVFVFLTCTNSTSSLQNNSNTETFLRLILVSDSSDSGYVLLYADESGSAIKERKNFTGSSTVEFQNLPNSGLVSFSIVNSKNQSILFFRSVPKGEWSIRIDDAEQQTTKIRLNISYPLDTYNLFQFSMIDQSITMLQQSIDSNILIDVSFPANGAPEKNPFYIIHENSETKRGCYYYKDTFQTVIDSGENPIPISLTKPLEYSDVEMSSAIEYVEIMLYDSVRNAQLMLYNKNFIPQKRNSTMVEKIYRLPKILEQQECLTIIARIAGNCLKYNSKYLPTKLVLPTTVPLQAELDDEHFGIKNIIASKESGLAVLFCENDTIDSLSMMVIHGKPFENLSRPVFDTILESFFQNKKISTFYDNIILFTINDYRKNSVKDIYNVNFTNISSISLHDSTLLSFVLLKTGKRKKSMSNFDLLRKKFLL